MKKTRFFLTALLLVTVLVFTSCGNRDNNANTVPDNQNNSAAQDIDRGADDLRDDADNLGDDIRDGIDDAADDTRDALDGSDRTDNNGDVSRNTADNGTRANLQ
ncbi:MAG: hypothetical protein ACI4LA_06960 [Emergencia sp.]